MCIVVVDDDVGLNVLGCRCIVVVVVVVVDHFHMALFSALEQTHCACM